jgi:hypothetical protein
MMDKQETLLATRAQTLEASVVTKNGRSRLGPGRQHLFPTFTVFVIQVYLGKSPRSNVFLMK